MFAFCNLGIEADLAADWLNRLVSLSYHPKTLCAFGKNAITGFGLPEMCSKTQLSNLQMLSRSSAVYQVGQGLKTGKQKKIYAFVELLQTRIN